MDAQRIYWIRYDSSDHVRVDVERVDEPITVLLQKLTGISSDDPEVLRLADEFAAADRAADILTILDRRYVRRPEDWTAAAHAYLVAPKTVLFATTAPGSVNYARGYLEAILLLALANQGDSVRLVFRHTRSNATAAALAPLLSRYELEFVRAQLPARTSFEAELTLSIPAAHLDVWFESPEQITRRFFRAWSRIAMTLQDVLRRWFRFEWLADLRRFEDHILSRALIVYWMNPPRGAQSYTEFVHDVMAPETLNRLCRGARRVSTEFGDIAKSLAAAGLGEIARHYRNPAKILKLVRRETRSLRGLLAIDSEVLDLLIAFGASARRLRTGEQDPDSSVPHAITVVSEFARDLRVRFRHGPLPEWSDDLATLVMIEATNAMRRGLDLPGGIDVQLRVLIQDGARLEFRTEALQKYDSVLDDTSTENLDEAGALPSQEEPCSQSEP